ncbi:MAG: hypothetical protein ACYSSI_02060 [Planctomycetota bacterium]|jgi:hypothetical protein
MIFDGMQIPNPNTGQQVADTGVESESDLVQTLPPPEQVLPKIPVDEKPKLIDTPETSKIETLYQQACQYIKNVVSSLELGVNGTKKITMIIMVPVLTIILIFTLTKVFRNPSRQKSVHSGQSAKEVIAISTGKINWKRPAPYPTTLRDPMQPANARIYQSETNSSFQNSDLYGYTPRGIVYSETNPSVIIGHKIMHEGDNVAGATIVKINKDNVIFEMNGKKWTQEVGKIEIKK